MSDQLRSIAFTALVAVLCSLMLTGAATGLKERKQRNIAVDRQKNILKSVGLIAPDEAVEIEQIELRYRQNIRCYTMDGAGQLATADAGVDGLPVCFYVKDDQPEAYIVPIDSRGLWGKIHGYMAIENDGQTVAGFSVYSHNETPGLGGEIERPWFQKNFVGKRILDASGEFVAIGIAKGKVVDVIASDRQANYVDGISGATLTGKYLSGGLLDILSAYEVLSKQFRSTEVQLPAGG